MTTVEETAAVIEESDGWEWAIVEILGHRKHAGRVREIEKFGTKMLRVDVPTNVPPKSLFDSGDGKPVPPPLMWTTHMYGGSSIFSFTPTDETTVMQLNRGYEPPSRYLPPPHRETELDDEQPF